MAPKNQTKKRVRIQSGHQARYIEKRNPYKRIKKSKKPKLPRNAKLTKSRSKIGEPRTHQPSVAELVYSYLERASSRGVVRGQKTNAPRQFRKLQRRKTSKKLRPDQPARGLGAFDEGLKKTKEEDGYRFPYERIPSKEGSLHIQKCIFDVLSLGSVLGLLVPADRQGVMFRVSSDLELFKKLPATRKRRRPYIDDDVTLAMAKKRRCW